MHVDIFEVFIILFITSISLAVGSFLNVVIGRLPLSLKNQSLSKNKNSITPIALFKNLTFPRSHCHYCKETLAFYDLIPLYSYYRLSGRCRSCKASISFRYPLVEILTVCLSLLVAIFFGMSLQTFPALILTWAFIAIAFIDIEHYLIPNAIIYPLLVLGLCCNFFALFISFGNALLGVLLGFSFLWSIQHLYKFFTGKEGIGFGDLKFLAMLGAWLGWKILPFIILLASLSGSVLGIILILQKRATRNTAMPFGAFLSLSGYIVLLAFSYRTFL